MLDTLRFVLFPGPYSQISWFQLLQNFLAFKLHSGTPEMSIIKVFATSLIVFDL